MGVSPELLEVKLIRNFEDLDTAKAKQIAMGRAKGL